MRQRQRLIPPLPFLRARGHRAPQRDPRHRTVHHHFDLAQRRRLVDDDQLRVADQRLGNAEALAMDIAAAARAQGMQPVVTALDAQGRPIGFTANSFASVSLEPPLLLVCLSGTTLPTSVVRLRPRRTGLLVVRGGGPREVRERGRRPLRRVRP